MKTIFKKKLSSGPIVVRCKIMSYRKTELAFNKYYKTSDNWKELKLIPEPLKRDPIHC